MICSKNMVAKWLYSVFAIAFAQPSRAMISLYFCEAILVTFAGAFAEENRQKHKYD